MTFGERIRKLRSEKKLQQNELSKMTGLTQTVISRIETGQVQALKPQAISSLATALGTSADYLVGRKTNLTAEELIRSDPEVLSLASLYTKLSSESRRMLVLYLDFLEYVEDQQDEVLRHIASEEELIDDEEDVGGMMRGLQRSK